LEYEYTVADDQKTVDIVERYTNSRAVLDHLANFGQNFSKDFMQSDGIRLAKALVLSEQSLAQS
jgi:hypothetical protein